MASNNTTFFQALGRQMKWADQRACASRINTYRVSIFPTLWAWFSDWLGITLAFLFHRHAHLEHAAVKAEQWLRIIQHYRPLILEQFHRKIQYFRQWESINRSQGAPSDLLDYEGAAYRQAIALTQEAEEKLRKVGYPYRPLEVDLLNGYESYETDDMAKSYWNALEAYFKARVRLLSEGNPEARQAYKEVTHQSMSDNTFYGHKLWVIIGLLVIGMMAIGLTILCRSTIGLFIALFLANPSISMIGFFSLLAIGLLGLGFIGYFVEEHEGLQICFFMCAVVVLIDIITLFDVIGEVLHKMM